MNNSGLKFYIYVVVICAAAITLLGCPPKKKSEFVPGKVELGNRLLCVLLPKQKIGSLVIKEVDANGQPSRVVADLRSLEKKKIILLKPGDYVFIVDDYSPEAITVEEDIKVTLTNRGRREDWVQVEPTRPAAIVFRLNKNSVNILIEKNLYKLAVLNVSNIPLNQLKAEVTGNGIDPKKYTYNFKNMEGNYAISDEAFKYYAWPDNYTVTVLVNNVPYLNLNKIFRVRDDDVSGPVRIVRQNEIFKYRTDSKSTLISLEFEDQNGIDADSSFITVNGRDFRGKQNKNNKRLIDFLIPANTFKKGQGPVIIDYTVFDNDIDRGKPDQSKTTGNITLIEMIGEEQTFKIIDKNNKPIPGIAVNAFNNVKFDPVMNPSVYRQKYDDNSSNMMSHYPPSSYYTENNGNITFSDIIPDTSITFTVGNDIIGYFAEEYEIKKISSTAIPVSFSRVPSKTTFKIEARVENQYAQDWIDANNSKTKTVSMQYEISRPEGQISRNTFLARNPITKTTEDYWPPSDTQLSITFHFDGGEINGLANINYLLTVEFDDDLIFSMNNAAQSNLPAVLTKY